MDGHCHRRRADGTSLPHSRLDRLQDDRLGRQRRQQRIKHRRPVGPPVSLCKELASMLTLLLFLSLLADPQLTVAARVDAERAVERARHQFVIGATKPFDELYPRSFFEARVAREM